MTKPLKLMVLAGGLGSRLRVAVSNVPKALAPIGNRPFLYLQVEHWKTQGITEFIFLLHHEADKIMSFLEAQKSKLFKNCLIHVVFESRPMGTGGAIAHAIEELKLKETFLVTNSDTWLGAGITEVAKSNPISMAVVAVPDASRYGRVEVNIKNKVLLFSEKNPNGDSGLINAGLYHLSPELFCSWDGEPFSLERDFLSNLVRSHNLTAVPLVTDFIDIGIPSDYYRFCDWVMLDREEPL